MFRELEPIVSVIGKIFNKNPHILYHTCTHIYSLFMLYQNFSKNMYLRFNVQKLTSILFYVSSEQYKFTIAFSFLLPVSSIYFID